jgi:hypothetical protein
MRANANQPGLPGSADRHAGDKITFEGGERGAQHRHGVDRRRCRPSGRGWRKGVEQWDGARLRAFSQGGRRYGTHWENGGRSKPHALDPLPCGC